MNEESGDNPLFLAERFVLRKNATTRSALPNDLPNGYSKIDVLVGDVTYESILYKQLSIKAKKYKYGEDKKSPYVGFVN